jgi:hypothetical protein
MFVQALAHMKNVPPRLYSDPQKLFPYLRRRRSGEGAVLPLTLLCEAPAWQRYRPTIPNSPALQLLWGRWTSHRGRPR